ncbi:hypothetical protein BDN72DRAFT_965561 [Pluteus cervinus]|uniref:Uncharacterized protein n=1 Tax=Pluteus cervinus TaxID=181527 RepID=A0ACD3A509_9AGAR|nr:hypothetical protein BDN72DRAFT_965561 [Pluteus cervinus]
MKRGPEREDRPHKRAKIIDTGSASIRTPAPVYAASRATAQRAQPRAQDGPRPEVRAGNAANQDHNPGSFPEVNQGVQPSADTALSSVQTPNKTGNQSYQPCERVKPAEADRTVNIIGVVVGVKNPAKTTTEGSEWYCILEIIDPTTDSKLSVNCFSKEKEEWLPVPNEGDVIILRNIKTSTYYANGVGSSNIFQWVIYASSTGKMHYGNQEPAAPKKEALEDGTGIYTPFCTYVEEELEECVELSEAWQERKKGSCLLPPISKPKRQHRMICDAGPDAPPDGFFDATVEVLSVHVNDNRTAYTVYVTDYTANTRCPIVQAEQCPSQLRLKDFALRITLQKDAARFGSTLQCNKYYTLKNLKAIKISDFFEAQAFEGDRKIYPAVADCPHLLALLDRKKRWELDNIAAASSSLGSQV